MTYRGRSLRAGSIFTDDEYGGNAVLQSIEAENLILQDNNGDPPSVHDR